MLWISQSSLQKMPTIQVSTVAFYLINLLYSSFAGGLNMFPLQLWKDSKKQAEVIGGNKAYLVINEVQEMIENECTM